MKMNMKLNKQVINLKALSAQPIKPVQIKVKPPKKAPKKATKQAREDEDDLFEMSEEDIDEILG